MTGTNQFLVYACGGGANVESQSSYASDPNLTIGQQPGVASSAFNNKVLRQAAYIASQIAQFLVNQTGQNCNDDGTPANIQALMTQVWPAPTGAILAFGAATAPTGFHNCDGSAISRTTYATLFGIIGTTYGTGDGSTTFNVPDCRGLFLRGSGNNGQITCSNGNNYSGTLGAYTQDEMQGHVHNPVVGGNPFVQFVGSGGTESINAGSNGATQNTTGAPHTDGTNGTPLTGAETRPANVGVNYIIKT